MTKDNLEAYCWALFLVLIAILAWEFWLGPLIGQNIFPDFQPETIGENWIYVATAFVFSAAALAIAAFFSITLKKRRHNPLAAPEKLQQKTESLLEQGAAESAQTRLKPADKTMFRENMVKIFETSQISVQHFMDSISAAMLVIDTSYQVRMYNKAARDLCFKDAPVAANPLCHKLLHNIDSPCSTQKHECPLKTVLESGRSCTVVHQNSARDIRSVPVEVQASPLFADNGTIFGIIEIIRDVPPGLTWEQKQKEAATRLLDLQRQRSIATLAGGLAHEFNNILASILGNAELLNVRLDENDVNKKQAKAIIDSSEQLADLTRELLAYAKEGKYLDRAISINELVNNSLHLIYTEKFADTEVELDLEDDLWPVQGDPAQITQLMINIMINGFEALEKTGGRLIIHSSNLTKPDQWSCPSDDSHPPGDYVFFSVTNTGSTINAALLEKIFDPFFSTKTSSRGIGLATAKSIVQSHQGCISVDCHQDQTTFQVLLPRAVAHADEVKPDSQPGLDLRNLKVLVVDDEPQILSIIMNFLERQGCKVLPADKGLEALEIIARHKAGLGLVILDIQMPDLTGDKVYRRLKEMRPDLKVLISSGYEKQAALRNIHLGSMDGFIKKPFRMSDLMQKIKEMMVQG